MKAAHRVVMNTGILYARMALTVLLSLYTTRVTLAALGVADFGIFNVVGGAIAMLTFLNTSMAAATQRFMSFAQGQGDESRQRQIFNVSALLHAAIAVILLVVLEAAGFVLFHGVLQIPPERIQPAWIVYQISILSTLFTILGVPYDAVINARENMLAFAVLGIIEAILKLGVALAISHLAADRLVSYGFLTAALTLILFLLRAAYCHARYHECALALRRCFDRKLFGEMTSFAGWSFLGTSTSMLANYGQGIVLNMFFGATVNAAQGIANQVSGQLGAFAGTMMRALNPLIVKSEGAGDRELVLKASVMGAKVGFFLLMFFYVPILIEAPYIFSIWLKRVPEYAVIFCRLLLLRLLVEQTYLTLVSAIAAVGDIRAFQVGTSLLNIFPLLAAYVFFRLGSPPYYIYLSFLVYSISVYSLVAVVSKVKLSIPADVYFFDVVVRCFAAFFICTVVSMSVVFFMDSGFIRLMCVTATSMLVFVPCVWMVVFSAEDRVVAWAFLVSAGRKVKSKINNYGV
jgi:O-antigen/teichoic acid export membrane protein